MASSPSTIDSGDTAFVLMSAAFIFLMTPAFAFFYGGMVDKKNILNTLTLSFICIGVISIQFFLVGYSFAFATGSRVFGDFSSAALYNWSNEASPYSPTIPSFAFFALQCAFAVVTPAIMSGSIVGRMKFKAYVIFIVLWSTLVYDPIAHCIWSSNGWLKALGVIDFSGGVVVHLSSGFSALVASVFVGKRENQVRTQDKHVAFTVLGAGLLWVGWFGFGSGSALQAGARASLAMLNINLAAAGGMLMWLFLDAMQRSAETPLVSSAAYGFTVGMVGITPGSGLVHPGWALVIGIVTCACSWAATELSRNWAWLDDTLDVFACHGIGGAIGSILVSLFAQSQFGGVNGSFYGSPDCVGFQLLGVIVVALYSAAATAAILYVLQLLIGLRVSRAEEARGLDVDMAKVDTLRVPLSTIRPFGRADGPTATATPSQADSNI